ncbi:DUF4062 domain-containing protein [Candidatus Palauibacter sp.]|uniref:DUF4062 domain-containing protein n=1 Tax=Candidatus Palauibacter sp. TaxID=3101350 RepID=UPI003B51DC75
MTPVRIFISSVQGEFTGERERVRDYLRGDPLMRRFFEVFLFEEVPASDQRPDRVYLEEVERCDIYVGLFGQDYGSENAEGVSPTEREFDCATELEKHRLIFVKGAQEDGRHPKMRSLIARAQAGLVRRRFATPAELVAGLYPALVQYLEAKEMLRFGPFDAAQCSGATLDDLDVEGMYRFIRTARRARQFSLPEETRPPDLLRHLNLLNRGRLTNAAVLLFGRAPQRFLLSSEIKCAHFHGTEVAKPIPSYQVYKGTVFALVDQAVDFVLGKIALSVGTRAESVQVPVAYEIPQEVVTEAVVNAVAHRDYTDNSSVQVMLFADRLEVMNSGRLPPPLTVEKLRLPHQSLPGNPLLAEAMYLLQYIERMGTGTVDMIRRCAEAGLPEPEFDVGAGFVTRIWRAGKTTQSTTRRSRSARKQPANNQQTTRKQPEKDDSNQKLADRVLALLRRNPSASRREIAATLGITESTVRYRLDKLRKAGKIERVGPDKGGHWKVLGDSASDPAPEPNLESPQ